MSSVLDALVCHVDVELPLASLSAASAQHEQVTYQLDQQHGVADCHVRQSGLFALRGDVQRFWCNFALHRADARLLHMAFGFDLTSFALRAFEQPGDVPLTAWFNMSDYPMVRFRSTAVTAATVSRQVVRGLLDIGGVTRLQALDLVVSNARKDPITGTDLVDLRFAGRFQQGALGILLSEIVPSNVLELTLVSGVELEGQGV